MFIVFKKILLHDVNLNWIISFINPLEYLPDAIKMYGSAMRDFKLGASSSLRTTFGCRTSNCSAVV